jgi:hypothetical protein
LAEAFTYIYSNVDQFSFLLSDLLAYRRQASIHSQWSSLVSRSGIGLVRTSRFDVKQQELVQVLDEVAFNLNKTYVDMMKCKDAHPFYVPDALKESFLRDNKFFRDNDISNNFMDSIPQPT